MQAPGFDFGASSYRYRLGILLTVVVALLMLTVAGVRYLETARTVAALEEEVTRLSASVEEGRVLPALRPDELARLDAQLSAAHAVIERLAVPWASLFRAVDTLSGDDVAFLSLEPDPVSGMVRLTGEARNFASAVDCIERARSLAAFDGVYLASHQIVEQQAARPVRFVMLARWRTERGVRFPR